MRAMNKIKTICVYCGSGPGTNPRFVEAAIALGNQGICVWDGDFYAARPVQVLGLAERGGLLRTGVSMYNTREELDRLLAGIEKLA